MAGPKRQGQGKPGRGGRGRPDPRRADPRRARSEDVDPRRAPTFDRGERIEGRQSVRELLAAGRKVRRVTLAEGLDPAEILDEIIELAAESGVPVAHVARTRLSSLAITDNPQGVIAEAAPVDDVDLDELCQPADGAMPLILVVAGVTDPRNLGALLRSAECAGVSGVVLPKHRSASLTPTVARTAAGAIEHLAFAFVGGIPNALSQLQRSGVTIVGLAGETSTSIYDVAGFRDALAVVVGSEEAGLPALVRARCDVLAAIPQAGHLPSLNVAVAGAVALFEIARQRAR